MAGFLHEFVEMLPIHGGNLSDGGGGVEEPMSRFGRGSALFIGTRAEGWQFLP